MKSKNFFFNDKSMVDQWLNTENLNFSGSKPITLITNERSDKVLLFAKTSLNENNI
jgi:hypothetical protein